MENGIILQHSKWHVYRSSYLLSVCESEFNSLRFQFEMFVLAILLMFIMLFVRYWMFQSSKVIFGELHTHIKTEVTNNRYELFVVIVCAFCCSHVPHLPHIQCSSILLLTFFSPSPHLCRRRRRRLFLVFQYYFSSSCLTSITFGGRYVGFDKCVFVWH